MINLLDLALALDDTADNFALLCKLIIDGRPNCFIVEDSLAVLNVEGTPWMLTGTQTPHGILYKFVDDE